MDEPLHAHLRQPILKILHSHGITRASSISLQVLSTLLDKYMKDVLLSCHEYAHHAGRSGLRIQDLVSSLEEMGSTLDDLGDYVDIEGGIRRDKDKAGINEESQGLQRYALAVGTRKEAELSEFKESLRLGLVAPEDRYSERLRYTRLPTPEPENENPYQPMAYSSDEEEGEEPVLDPTVQLPLSPISNSPPHARNSTMDVDVVTGLDEESYLLPFLPPFPQIVPEATGEAAAEAEKEKEEEKQREAELLKQKESIEAKSKENDGDEAPVVHSFPANYIVPAPYDVSKLQARGTWHLPSISSTTLDDDSNTSAAFSSSSPLKTTNPGLPTVPPTKPYVKGESTTEELLTALHSLTPTSQTDLNNPITPSSLLASTTAATTVSTNPLRHKVSLVFLGTTPARYNTPDTLFGLAPSAAIPPRPSHPLPSYVNVLEVQPGMRDIKGKKQVAVGDMPVPPSTGRNVGVPAAVVAGVTGTTSRIPTIGKRILARPTLARTKRLAPPPPQKREEKPILYHASKNPLLAHWNMAVSGSNSQYSGALDQANAKAAAELAKVSKEKNPYGVAEATLAYTWDWHAKHPWEGLDSLRGGTAFGSPPPPPAAVTNVASASTPGGSGLMTANPSLPRIVPKISVNFPGRRSSTLSSITPSTGAPGNSALIARLPGLAERSPSYSHAAPPSLINPHTGAEGSMLPPPLRGPQNAYAQSNERPSSSSFLAQPMHITREADMKEEDDKEDVMMMMESVLGPDLTVETPVEDMELDSAISQLVGESSTPPMRNDRSASVDMPNRDPAFGSEELDGDIDKEIADVLGDDDEADDVDGDVDADIAEALGSEVPAGGSRPSSVPSAIPASTIQEEPQLDMELADLLDETSASPQQYLTSSYLQTTPGGDYKVQINAMPTSFETLGVGEPPAAPGDGSAVLLSEMDYLPASSSGTLAFASSTTLPLATSALRSTTTPRIGTPGYGSPAPAAGIKQEEATPALEGLHMRPASIEYP